MGQKKNRALRNENFFYSINKDLLYTHCQRIYTQTLNRKAFKLLIKLKKLKPFACMLIKLYKRFNWKVFKNKILLYIHIQAPTYIEKYNK